MKKHTVPLLLLVSIALFVYWRWFFTSGILTYGDFTVDFPAREKEFFSFPLLWHAAGLFGFSDIGLTFWPFLWMTGLLAALHFPPPAIERIIFLWPTALISLFSSYCLSYYIFKNKKAAVVSALVFSFNTSFLTTLTGILTVSTAVSFFPLITLFFMLLLERKRIIYALLTGLTAFILGFYDFRMLYMIFWVLLFYFLYHLIFLTDQREQVKSIKKLILLLSVLLAEVVILNAYWFLGLVNTNSIINNNFFTRSLIGGDLVDIAKSISLFLYLWTNAKYYAFVVQPIPFYFWFVPFFAFLGLLYHKRNKKIAFFAIVALLGIFLSKQSNPPFATTYLWLYAHLPGFNAFRESTKFYYLIMFGYSILIAGFIAFLSEWAKKTIQKRINAFLVFFISTIFLINTKPLITGEIGTLFTPHTIPPEYYALNTFLSSDPTFYRTLSIPNTQRFTYYSNHHPEGGLFALPDSLRIVNPKLLNLENFKYIILPYDSMDDIYSSYGPRSAFMKYVNKALYSQQKNWFIEKQFGHIHVWENTQAYPHIFTLHDLVYINQTTDLASIIDFPTSDSVGYYFEQTPTETTTTKVAKYLTDVNNTMSLLATKTYYVTTCVRCDLSRSTFDYIVVPFAKYYPDSPLYGFVEAKERSELKLAQADIASGLSINSELFLKRIVEIQGLLSKRNIVSVITETLDREDTFLENISKLINTIKEPIAYNDALLNVSDYLAAGERILADQLRQEQSGTINALLTTEKFKIDTVLKIINEKVWKTDENTVKLIVNLPTDDNYDLYMKNDPDNNSEKSELIIGTQSAHITFDQYDKIGNLFLTKGIHPIALKLSPLNLLESNSTSLKVVAQDELQNIVIPIKSLHDPRALYKLTFDYTIISGDSPRVYIEDHASTTDVFSKQKYYPVSTLLADTGDGKAHTSTTYFHPHYGSTNPELHIDLQPHDFQRSETDLTNMQLTKVMQPTIAFIKQNRPQYELPKLSFEEVSPTYYKVHVTNAKRAYVLSFAEGFDIGWKAYIDQTDLKYSGVLKKYPRQNVTELQAFDTKIGGIFSMFFGKRTSIPEATHGIINGFGNVWTIDKTGSYTIDIIFTPELSSIIGSIISLLCILFVILSVSYLLVRRRW